MGPYDRIHPVLLSYIGNAMPVGDNDSVTCGESDVHVLDFEEEVADGDVEVVAEHDDGIDAEVAFAVFDVGNIFLREAGVLADLLLGDAAGLADLENGATDLLTYFDGVVEHKWMYWMRLMFLRCKITE